MQEQQVLVAAEPSLQPLTCPRLCLCFKWKFWPLSLSLPELDCLYPSVSSFLCAITMHTLISKDVFCLVYGYKEITFILPMLSYILTLFTVIFLMWVVKFNNFLCFKLMFCYLVWEINPYPEVTNHQYLLQYFFSLATSLNILKGFFISLLLIY